MDDSVEVYQQALRASTRISYDLGTGSQASFVHDTEGFALASARPPSGPFQIDSTGQILWQKYVFYYIEDEVMYRGEIPIDPPVSNLTSTPTINDLRTQLGGPGMIMVKKVSDFQVTQGSGASLIFKISGQQTLKNSLSLQTRISFRQ